MTDSSGPALGALRIATPSDILRMGIVSTCSFRYSPLFEWERCYHETYPEDTLLSYREELVEQIKDPKYIVLVASDKYDPDEARKSIAILPENNGWEAPAAGEDVIVGFACWKLEPGSKRQGQYKNDSRHYPVLPPNQNRDQNADHVRRFSALSKSAHERHFHGMSEMDQVAVHPAYWKRGHGTALVKWGMELARMDQVAQGVSAAKMGEKLYAELCYRVVERIGLDGDEVTPQGVSTAMMVYDPRG
ncbi:Acyl- N-acyltransferase protein [Rutstroemia sp. NJR-2017a BBW]|nr:Acyl- N-acyltransferase protein [Rutstroemia sp. NJR-2017a BBW]